MALDKHGRDPGILDIIQYYDQPEHCAWHLLTDKEAKVLHDEIEKCSHPDTGFPYIARNYYWITTKDVFGQSDILLHFKETQEMTWEMIRYLRLRKPNGVKLMIIKARQLYISSFCEALLAWLIQFNPNSRGLLVSYNEEHAGKLFGMILHIYDQLPWWLRPMIGSRKYETGIHLINPDHELRRANPGLNSRITVQGATQNVGVGEGETINFSHLCLAPHTLIHTAGGVPKPISEVQPGDTVITSRGLLANVKKVCRSPRRHELTNDLWMWGEFAPLSSTRDHKILCPEGFREAKDIKAGDYVCRPVRPITENGKAKTIIQYTVGGVHTKRPQMSIPVEMNFDWGWVLGFYLAEGSVKAAHGVVGFSEITFGIDQDEAPMVEENLRKILPKNKHIGHYRSNSRTHVVRVSWAALARFVEESCGHVDTKRVPDWAWGAGRDFCRGLVAGYLQGDGHLAIGRNDISAQSVRPAILIQMRDMAASLGYGWSSIYFREAGVYYERNCRAQWSWHMVSEVAKRCKDDLGWADTAERPPQPPTHWRYSDDGKFVHIQVDRNLDGFSESFYDLEVDAPEHDFCTIQCCVKNSEFGSWDPAKARKIIMGDFRWALPDAPSTTAILETRVQKNSEFAEKLWEKMVSLGEDADWYPFFIPIYFDRSHFVPPRAGWKPEEPELLVKQRACEEWCACDKCGQIRPAQFGGADIAGIPCRDCKAGTYTPYVLQDGQMLWLQKARMNAVSETARVEMQQSLATNPQDAFASIADTLFSKQAREWVAHTTRNDCLARGYMSTDGVFHAPRRISNPNPKEWGEESAQCFTPGCKVDHRGEGERYLKIWQPPLRGARYAMAVDVSQGYKLDYSVIWVNKIGRIPEPDIQVAMYRCNTIGAHHLADVVNSIGRWYNNALAIVDYTNCNTTGDRLLLDWKYPNIYQWTLSDAIRQNKNRWHWVWNAKNKEGGWQTLDGWLRDRSLIVKDPVFAQEMRHFHRRPDGSVGCPEGDDGTGEFEKIHDDTVMACISLVIGSHQNDPRRPAPEAAVPQLDGLRGPGEWRGTCVNCKKSFAAQAPHERDRCPFCQSIFLNWRMDKMEQVPLGFDFMDMGGMPGHLRDRMGAPDEFSFGHCSTDGGMY